MNAVPDDLPNRAIAAASRARVLFITRKWGPAVGGMETYCERLTEELGKFHQVDVIALKGQANGKPPGALALLGFPFTVLIRLLDRGKKPSIIHMGDMAIWPLGLLALLFHPHARLVLSAHGTDVSFGRRGGVLGSLYSAYQSLGAWLLPGAKVIANSQATGAQVSSMGWNSEAVIPLATDLAGEFADEPVSGHDPNQVLFAGRLIRLKGCSWFVNEVLPLLPQNVRLCVVGTRWDHSENAALESDRVEFLGRKSQDELAGMFAKAGCVVVPNIEMANGQFEGFGLVAPEAASAGGVVIASASGGLKDAVIDGETGFLIAPGDAQAWADKIIEVLNWSAGRRGEFVAHSRTLAQHHFSWSRVASQTSAVYRAA